MFLCQPIPGDDISSAFWRVHADPDEIDLFGFLIVGTGELPAILSGDHAVAIVYAAFGQRIAGIKIILGFDVYNQANRFPRARGDGAEADIVGDCPLMDQLVRSIQTADR